MDKLFFWNAFHNGDVIFTRPLVRAVLDQHDVEIAWGCFHNHKYLIEDLPVQVLVDPRVDRQPCDLSYLCPPGYHAINTWIGQYAETRLCRWSSVVETYNRQIQAHGLRHLSIHSQWVPMVDFPHVELALDDESIFVANGAARSNQSPFAFNMEALAREFPDLTFYCVAHPQCPARNVVDCSNLNLVQLSALSNRCRALIGIPGGALDCTFTEPNRCKPRAIMGMLDRAHNTIWEFPGLSVRYLDTHEQLREFLGKVACRPRLALRTQPGVIAVKTVPPPPAEPALAQVMHAIEQVNQNPANQAAMALLVQARAAVAKTWASLSPGGLAAAYSQEICRIYQALLEFRLRGHWIGEWRCETPIGDPADQSEEWRWARDLAASFARDPSNPALLPALMAAMLYLNAHEIPVPPDLSIIPRWFLQWYLHYVFCAPCFRAPGDAHAFAEHVARWTEYLDRQITHHPQQSEWCEAARAFLHANLAPLLATELDLKTLQTQRARIITHTLLDSGIGTEHSFPPRPRQRIRLGLLLRHLRPQPLAALDWIFGLGPHTFNTDLRGALPLSMPSERAALELCRYIDRNIFEVVLLSPQPLDDDARSSFANRAENVILLTKELHEQVRFIRSCDLDLMVFASPVTTAAHPLTALAQFRLARIQIALNNCQVTTGMRHMDYFVSGDLIESINNQDQFSERLLLIPGVGACAPPAAPPPPPSSLNRQRLNLGPTDIVFACGANYYKLTPELEETWARILAAVPHSCLLVFPFDVTRFGAFAYPPATLHRRLRQTLERHGLSPGRILLFGPELDHAVVAQRLLLADIYLDTFPNSGFHSVIDALKVGLPVVAREGTRGRSRRGAAMLRELDLPELVAQNERQYVDLAVRLASDASFRALQSQRVRAAMQRQPRFLDPAFYAAELQKLFRQLAIQIGFPPAP